MLKTKPIHHLVSIYPIYLTGKQKCGSRTKEASLSSTFLEGELSDIKERIKQKIKRQVSRFTKIKQQFRGRQD